MAVYKLPETDFSITTNWEKEDFFKIAKEQEYISISGPHSKGYVDARVKIITHVEDGKNSNMYHGRIFMPHSHSFAAEYRVYKYDFATKQGHVFERGKVYEEIFTVLEPLTESNPDQKK